LIAVKISSKPPVLADCPVEGENSYEQDVVNIGDQVVMTAYLTDQQVGETLNLKVINPQGGISFSRGITFTQESQ
jgi:hypothetical protein